jgi:hypothetical protein
MKYSSQSNTILNNKIMEKVNYKKEKNESTELTCQTCNPVHEIETT